MRKQGIWIVAVLALAVIAGGGYYAYTVFVENQLRSALDRAFAELPAGYSAAYKTVQYSPASRDGALTGFTLHKADPQGFDLAIDEVRLSKPDLDFAASWARAQSNPAAVTPDTALKLVDRIAMKGVSYQAGALHGSIGALTLDGLRLYPWSLLQPGVPSWPEALSLLQRPQSPSANLANLQPLFQFFAAWGLAVGYDRYAIEDTHTETKVPMPPNNALTDATYSVRKVSAIGGDRGVIAEGTVEGYAIEAGPAFKASVERMDLSGLDARRSMTQLAVKKTFTPEILDGLRLDRAEYTGMHVELPGTPPFTLRSIRLGKIAFAGAVPVSGEFALDGIELRQAQMKTPQAADAFAKLGLDVMTIDIGLAYQWNVAQHSIAVSDVSLAVKELGSLKLSLDVTDVGAGLVGPLQARLGHAVLRYRDNSLMARAIQAGADLAHLDGAAYRQQLATVIEARASAFPDSPVLQAAAKEISAFLNEPQSLLVELSPPRPVPLMALTRAGSVPPPQLVDLLGLNVAANR